MKNSFSRPCLRKGWQTRRSLKKAASSFSSSPDSSRVRDVAGEGEPHDFQAVAGSSDKSVKLLLAKSHA